MNLVFCLLGAAAIYLFRPHPVPEHQEKAALAISTAAASSTCVHTDTATDVVPSSGSAVEPGCARENLEASQEK